LPAARSGASVRMAGVIGQDEPLCEAIVEFERR
jgi:hypothetical protein